MPNKISVLISSTIADLEGDMDAVSKALQSYDFVEMIGAHPLGTTAMGNPYHITRDFAEACDLYILILGDRFGFEIPSGRSATAVEFDAASQFDPTTVIVFRKSPFSPEPKQKLFADQVGAYESGDWINDYRYTHDLERMTKDVFVSGLKHRGGIGSRLTALDRFIILGVQSRPSQNASLEYRVTDNDVEFMYSYKWATHLYYIRKYQIKLMVIFGRYNTT
jgi:hypothetical protein